MASLRSAYHRNLCKKILFVKKGIPNIADSGSKASVAIATEIIGRLHHPLAKKAPPGQTAGVLFEQVTRDFLRDSFDLLHHLRPGKWLFDVNRSISQFEQYEHVANLQRTLREKPELAAALGGDYLVTPDITVGRYPMPDDEINRTIKIVSETEPICRFTPLRSLNRSGSSLILHSSISCKWTVRSDRAQNIRTEALNLIRNRKGNTPHIMAVTAEPLPTRLASLALGTGDLDCVYHFALPELREAVEKVGGEDQLEMLLGMVDGRRLRDISDLPFDLAI
ncbi:MAG TPA: NgoMIV family type II restriction endonuclease [Thermodesulfobacteriota bacterium]|nr:NgoMIV family type II restriction endonuclease [Thermodesulfobacteriota bacterium]